MKEALIIVDYQKDFVDGALGFPGAELLDGPIVRRIQEARQAGHDIIFTYDTHGADYLSTREGQGLPVPHCLEDSDGWQLYGTTAGQLQSGDAIFRKPAFGSLELAQHLRDKGYDRVTLVGLVSNICVLANAVLAKTALPEAEVAVDAACTSSADPDLHQKALDVLAGLQITVVNRP